MQHPSLETITQEERQRFVTACKGDLKKAENGLLRYVEFCDNELTSHQNSLMIARRNQEENLIFDECFLRFLAMTNQVALDGTRVVYVIPAALDLSRHDLQDTDQSAENYEALSIACYFNENLRRDSLEKLTVLIDVRGGIGKNFSNTKPLTLISFAQKVIYYLENYFPERMGACILFPMPSSAMFIWRLVRVFIDRDTRKRFRLVSGDPDALADMPTDDLVNIISLDCIEELEKRRWEFFDFDDIEGGLEAEVKRRNRKNHHNWIRMLI